MSNSPCNSVPPTATDPVVDPSAEEALPPARLAELYHKPRPRQPLSTLTTAKNTSELPSLELPVISPGPSRAEQARQELEKTRLRLEKCPTITSLMRLNISLRIPQQAATLGTKRKYPENGQIPELSTSDNCPAVKSQTPEPSTSDNCPAAKRKRVVEPPPCQTPESAKPTNTSSISPTGIPQSRPPLSATPRRSTGIPLSATPRPSCRSPQSIKFQLDQLYHQQKDCIKNPSCNQLEHAKDAPKIGASTAIPQSRPLSATPRPSTGIPQSRPPSANPRPSTGIPLSATPRPSCRSPQSIKSQLDQLYHQQKDYIKNPSCNQLEHAKDAAKIGALHSQTMEPYRQGALVYDSDDEVSHAVEHDWRLFRASQVSERTTPLSIVRKLNPPSQSTKQIHNTKTKTNNNLISEMRQLWNEYVTKILVKKSYNDCSNLVLNEFMIKRFIKDFYFHRFKSNLFARSELIKFLFSFDFLDSNLFNNNFNHFLKINSTSNGNHPNRINENYSQSYECRKIAHVHSFIKFYDSLQVEKK